MDGIIRKIIIGRDPKDAMAYYIGMRAGDGKVSAIVMDEEHLYRYQKKRYLVYLHTYHQFVELIEIYLMFELHPYYLYHMDSLVQILVNH